jgi:hypothetical protein
MSSSDDLRKKAVHKLVDSSRNIKKVIIPHKLQVGKKNRSVNSKTRSEASGSSYLADLTVRDDDGWCVFEMNCGNSSYGSQINLVSGGDRKGYIYQYNTSDMGIISLVDDIHLQTQDSIIIDAKGRDATNPTGGSGISFRTNSTSKMYIHNNGTVSIGTTTPDTGPILHIKSGSTDAGHTTNAYNTVVIEDEEAAIVRLASADDSYGKIGFSTSHASNQGYITFYGSTTTTYGDRIYLGIGGSGVAYFRDSSDNNLFLDGNLSEDAFFTEGHVYSSDQDLESGDAVSLSGQKIVKTTSANQKDVVGIAWYQVYKRREEAGFEVFRNVGDHVPSESKKKRDSLGNYLDQGIQNESGEWEVTSEFKKLWKVASIGDTRQQNEGEVQTTLMGFKVCDQNGSITKGDLLVTSDTPGYLMKQLDDIIRSSTVGKAMEPVTFNSDGLASGVYGFLYCG